ncbi:hypothetical protein D3C76_1287020 [compost metagenome]
MNSQSWTPSNAAETNRMPINLGWAQNRRSRSATRRHSPDPSMNRVMHGTVNSMRQPKISTPLNGLSNEV